MIKSIELNNFQSHKHSKLEFSPGVNVIIGSSNSGKSAILRGLFWNINNRPSGTEFISFFNLDKKGNPVNPTSSIVETETVIERKRDKEFNGYLVNEKPLEAVALSVPEEVTTLLNFSEVNVQKQMDSPFLLSETNGEVARFFNRVIRLDIIDKVLTSAESKKRENKRNLEVVNARVSELQKTLSGYDWVEQADLLCAKAEVAEKEFNRISSQRSRLSSLVEELTEFKMVIEQNKKWKNADEIAIIYSNRINEFIALQSKKEALVLANTNFINYREQIERLGWVKTAYNTLEKAQTLYNTLTDKRSRKTALNGVIEAINRDSLRVKSLNWIPSAEKLSGRFIKYFELYNLKERSKRRLGEIMKAIGIFQKENGQRREGLEILQSQLPNSCPTCGASL